MRVLPPRHDIAQEDGRPTQCALLLDGWAYRYKLLNGGGRQIMSFHVAGDLLDIQNLYLPVSDHSIGTIKRATVAFVSHESLRALLARLPELEAALRRDAFIDAAIFREWVVNVGRRPAYQRLAHLFCEMYLKQEAVGIARAHRCPFPITQTDLADATGLTSVHVNRTLRSLKQAGLITLGDGHLTIHDWPELAAAAGFNPAYLHLKQDSAAPAA